MSACPEQTIAVAFDLIGRFMSGEMRNVILRLKMGSRRSNLLKLKGDATAYLSASFAVLMLVPMFGWWIGLICLPLSLAGALRGKAWRDLLERWEQPIVLEVPASPSTATKGER